MKRAIREKMIPMLAAFASSHDLGLGDAPAQLAKVFRILTREHYRQLRPILEDLERGGVPVVLIKGADLDLTIYRQRLPRVMGDVDVLVRPQDVASVSAAFRSQGFIQGKLDERSFRILPLTEPEKADFEEDSIELAEFSRLSDVRDLVEFDDLIKQYLSYWRMRRLHDSFSVVIGIDVHIHLSLDFDLRDVWVGLRNMDSPEVGRCLAQSFTDMAWYLTLRFYHEHHLNNAAVMRSFLDVLAVILEKHEQIDWDRILFIASRYKLQPALFYTFWHIDQLFQGLIPQTLLDALSPANPGSDRGHDWGDFIPKMLGTVVLAPLASGSATAQVA